MSHWTDFAFSGFYCLILLALVFQYKKGSGIRFATENKAERFLIAFLMFTIIWIVSSGELELGLGYGGRALLFGILWWASLVAMTIQVVVAIVVLILSPAPFSDFRSAK